MDSSPERSFKLYRAVCLFIMDSSLSAVPFDIVTSSVTRLSSASTCWNGKNEHGQVYLLSMYRRLPLALGEFRIFSLSCLFYFNLIRTNTKRDSMAKFDQGQLIVKKKKLPGRWDRFLCGDPVCCSKVPLLYVSLCHCCCIAAS